MSRIARFKLKHNFMEAGKEMRSFAHVLNNYGHWFTFLSLLLASFFTAEPNECMH